ncbi:MAG: hypothetical protein V5786_03055 [Psychromonas sp.]
MLLYSGDVKCVGLFSAIELTSPEQRTIPRQMFSGLREQISPETLAVATLLVFVFALLLLTLEYLRARSEKIRTGAV